MRFSAQAYLAALVLGLPIALVAMGLQWLVLDLSASAMSETSSGLGLLAWGMVLLTLVLVVRYLLLLWLAFAHARKELAQDQLIHRPDEHWPFISLVMPVFNERKLIAQVLEWLADLDYPEYEILVVDDGSSDNTFLHAASAIRQAAADRHVDIRLLPKPNGGKSDALNHGLAHARGEIVVCIDGDAVLERRSLKWLVAHFDDPRVGAVAGNVRASNRETVYGMFQALEYTQGLGLVKRAQSEAGVVAIIPGPLGAFRKQAIAQVGGYAHDTFAEDFDLSLNLLADGWQLVYEHRAMVFTQVPESLMQLIKQRYRWSRGALQVLRKRWDYLASPLKTPWGFWGVLYLTLEMLVMPFVHVLGLTLFCIGGLQAGVDAAAGIWWIQLIVLDCAIAMYCVVLERERWSLVAVAPFARIYYQVLLDVVRIFSTIEEFLGVKMTWGKRRRLGKV